MKSLFFILLSLLIYCSGNAQRVHTDKKAGFEIKIPGDWKRQRNNSSHQLLAFLIDKHNVKIDSRLFVTVMDYKNVNQDSIVYNYEKNQKYHYPTYKILESTVVEIDNRKFYRMIGEHHVPEGIFRTLSFVSSGDGKWIVLNFGAHDEKFFKMKTKFDEIASSFTLLKK